MPALVVAFMVVVQVLHNGLNSSLSSGLALAIQLLMNSLLSGFRFSVSGDVRLKRRIYDLLWHHLVESFFDLIASIDLDGTF